MFKMGNPLPHPPSSHRAFRIYLCAGIFLAYLFSHNLAPASVWVMDWTAGNHGHSFVFEYEEHDESDFCAAVTSAGSPKLQTYFSTDHLDTDSLSTTPLLPPPRSIDKP